MHVIDIRHSLFGGMKSHFWCSQNNFIRQMFHFYIFSKYVSPLLELFGCIEAGIGTSHIVVCLVCHWRTEQAQLNCRMIEVEKFTWRKKILTFSFDKNLQLSTHNPIHSRTRLTFAQDFRLFSIVQIDHCIETLN